MNPLYMLGVLLILPLLASLTLVLSLMTKSSYNPSTTFGWLGMTILSRKAYRWNELRTVRESFPYVGTREAYVENRAAVYFLFSVIPIWFRRFQIEVETNLLINVMTLGSQINGDSMDQNFPPYLAYKKDLGKSTSFFQGEGLLQESP